MSKVAVVYWSSTGNTEAMANAVADGIRGKKAAKLFFIPVRILTVLKLLNMMQSPSDALQWEMKFSKIQNSSQCLTDAKMP